MYRMQSSICKAVELRVAPSIADSVSLSLTSTVEELRTKLTESLSQSMLQLNDGVFPRQDSQEKSEAEAKVLLLLLTPLPMLISSIIA